ncbi:9500_t:CDS:2, partial [Scutellospora calospora]
DEQINDSDKKINDDGDKQINDDGDKQINDGDKQTNDSDKKINDDGDKQINDDKRELSDKYEEKEKTRNEYRSLMDKDMEQVMMMMQDTLTLIPLCYPACRSIYNIFHKAEPLVARHYSKALSPALIPYHKGGLKAVQLGFQEFGSNISKSTTNLFKSLSFSKNNKDEPLAKRKNNKKTREKHFIERELLKQQQLKRLYSEAGSSVSLLKGSNTRNSSCSSLESISSNDRISIDTRVARNSIDSSYIGETDERRDSVDSNFGIYNESPRGLSVEAREKFYMSHVELSSTVSEEKEQFYNIKTSSSPVLNEDGQLDYQISGEEKLKSLNKSGRIDYCLQEGVLEVSYISAITDHLSYWTDCDAAYFILRETYRNYDDD